MVLAVLASPEATLLQMTAFLLYFDAIPNFLLLERHQLDSLIAHQKYLTLA